MFTLKLYDRSFPNGSRRRTDDHPEYIAGISSHRAPLDAWILSAAAPCRAFRTDSNRQEESISSTHLLFGNSADSKPSWNVGELHPVHKAIKPIEAVRRQRDGRRKTRVFRTHGKRLLEMARALNVGMAPVPAHLSSYRIARCPRFHFLAEDICSYILGLTNLANAYSCIISDIHAEGGDSVVEEPPVEARLCGRITPLRDYLALPPALVVGRICQSTAPKPKYIVGSEPRSAPLNHDKAETDFSMPGSDRNSFFGPGSTRSLSDKLSMTRSARPAIS